MTMYLYLIKLDTEPMVRIITITCGSESVLLTISIILHACVYVITSKGEPKLGYGMGIGSLIMKVGHGQINHLWGAFDHASCHTPMKLIFSSYYELSTCVYTDNDIIAIIILLLATLVSNSY